MEIEVLREQDLEDILKELEIPKEKVSRLSIVELQELLIEARDESDAK